MQILILQQPLFFKVPLIAFNSICNPILLFFDCNIFLYLVINYNFLKLKKLICKKIKTSPIPVSDVLPLFWFFMVQYISISVSIIVFIFYLVNDIINCLYYFLPSSQKQGGVDVEKGYFMVHDSSIFFNAFI